MPLPDQQRRHRRAASSPKCGYSLRGLRGLTCPECGHTVTAADLTRPVARPRWQQVALGPVGVAALVLVNAVLTWAVQSAPTPASGLLRVLFVGFSGGRGRSLWLVPPIVPGLLALCLFGWLTLRDSNPFLSVDEDVLVMIAAALTAIYALGALIILL